MRKSRGRSMRSSSPVSSSRLESLPISCAGIGSALERLHELTLFPAGLTALFIDSLAAVSGGHSMKLAAKLALLALAIAPVAALSDNAPRVILAQPGIGGGAIERFTLRFSQPMAPLG